MTRRSLLALASLGLLSVHQAELPEAGLVETTLAARVIPCAVLALSAALAWLAGVSLVSAVLWTGVAVVLSDAAATAVFPLSGGPAVTLKRWIEPVV